MKKMMLATMMALVAGSAAAQVSIEGAFGPTDLNVDCTGASHCEKSGTGAKLVVGYAVNPNIAVEAGYVNFGEAKAGGTIYRLGATEVTLKSNAFYIGGAFRGDFAPSFAGVARLGIAQVETKIEATSSVYGAGSDSKSKANALFGLAVEYAVTPKVKVTGGVDFTQSPIAEDNETATLRLLSLGLKYNF
jgi:OOP family OmpA-OmpF porin